MFGKSFLWNQSLFNHMDQAFLFSNKNDKDDEGKDHPKGFEKFFKKKEQRDTKKEET